MALISLQYRFRQPFRADARSAYSWCTDYRASDAAYFGDRRTRAIRWLAADTLVMTDTTYPKGRRVRIQRLVRLSPGELSWTNTHLSGPFRHSQYWYRIVADGPQRSHLDFRGLKLERRAARLARAATARRAEAERREDASLWRDRLAPALESDLGRSGRGVGRGRKRSRASGRR